MKRIFTFLASLMVSISLLAADARPKSTLTVRSSDRSGIKVVIDGRRFEPLDNYVRIQGIDAGMHSVKIYREKYMGLFSILGKKYEVVFNSSISVKPRTSVVLSVDRFGRTSVNETRMFDRGDRGFGRDLNNDGQRWDKDHDFNYDNGGRYGDYDSRDGRDRNWDNSRDRNGGFDDRDHGYNDNSYDRTMSDVEFNTVLSSMNREWSENNKMKSATQIISTNFFTTVQVKQILQQFSIENNKLELAKLAYSKTIDQKNYFMINDVFSFNSSRDELARFIRSH